MADSGGADLLRPSLLDRLMRDESDRPRGLRPFIGFRELRESVGRDLEWLLNSRCLPIDLEAFPEARESLLSYGVPDLSTYSWRNPADWRRIAVAIEEAIRRFEPRLAPSSVKVEIVPGGGVDDFQLHFRIDAMLQVDPVSEPVSFDTEVDVHSSSLRITGSS